MPIFPACEDGMSGFASLHVCSSMQCCVISMSETARDRCRLLIQKYLASKNFGLRPAGTRLNPARDEAEADSARKVGSAEFELPGADSGRNTIESSELDGTRIADKWASRWICPNGIGVCYAKQAQPAMRTAISRVRLRIGSTSMCHRLWTGARCGSSVILEATKVMP